jgi:putative acetyltransferase
MNIRLVQNSDLDEILKLYYENIHYVCKNDYTEEQLEAWAPKNPDKYRWEISLRKNHALVVVENDEIIGFGDIGETGYIDRLYVRKDCLHRGVASQILDHLEKYARKKGMLFLNIAASITSQPFFEARGFTTIQTLPVERRGIRMRRYLMEKKL